MRNRWDSATEPDLLRGVAEQEPGATEEFVLRYWTLAFRIALGVVKNKTVAEDVAQETIVNVMYYIMKTKPDVSFLWGYVGKSAFYMALRTLKKANQRYTVPLFEDIPAVFPSAVSSLVCQELHAIVEHCIDRLPAEYRLAVILCYLEERTYRDAAASMGISKATIGRYIRRASPLLQKCIEDSGVYAEGEGND